MTFNPDTLAHHIGIAASLIGNGYASIHDDYIRALAEFICDAHGINTDHKDTVTTILLTLASEDDPQNTAHAFTTSLATSITLAAEKNPATDYDYYIALAEHACRTADISRDNATTVIDLIKDLAGDPT